MEHSSTGDTSITLLGRVSQDQTEEAAWRDFVHRYGPLIYTWCKKWSPVDADAEDVTQNVLLKMFVRIKTFVYDPSRSFRAWLKTVTHHAWRDYQDEQRRASRGSSGEINLDSLTPRDDAASRLSDEFDEELLFQAMARVRDRVEAHTWEAFQLLTQEGQSTAAVAERTGMLPATVLVAKSKVVKMLREEIRRLEAAAGTRPPAPENKE